MSNQTNTLSIADRYARIAEEAEQRNNAPATPPKRSASPKQITFLTDLRTRYNIPVEDIASLSAKEVYDEIQELMKRPAPVSPSQMEVINKTIEELRLAGMKINISDEKIASLSGGKEGTASKMINFLFTKRTEIETAHKALYA